MSFSRSFWVGVGLGVFSLGLVACGDSGGSAQVDRAVAADTADAITEANAACDLGDVSSDQVSNRVVRATLEALGHDVSGLTDDAVSDLMAEVFPNDPRWSEEYDAAEERQYQEATEHAARAAALDSRWDSLHRALSNFVSHMRGPGSLDRANRQWFEDIRVGCERASTLSRSGE